MKQLTQNAQELLDKYLQEVRLCLQGSESVDVDEIHRDIIEHIEQELESAAEPVSFEELDKVLIRLGSPRQWEPQDEMSWFHRMSLRLRTGPDDWRLAYITLGTFVLACISGPGAILLIPLSFYFARTALTLAGGPEQLGNQKYLIIPPLVCTYIIFTFLELALPFCLLAFARHYQYDLFHASRLPDIRLYWALVFFITLLFAGTWWLLVGVLSRGRAKKVYYPFGVKFTRRLPYLFCIMGLIMVLTSCILAFKYFWAF